MNKSILTLGCASMLLASSILAYETMEDRLDTLEKEMTEVSSRNPQGTLGAAFTSSRPEITGKNWFTTFSVIYWHPKMGGTEYAYTNDSQNIIFSSAISRAGLTVTIQRPGPPNGTVKANDFGWDLGIKAGLGYKTPHDKWDVYARYTWFNSDDNATSRKDKPSYLIALKSLAALIASNVKSHVDIDYKNIDLELARSFFITGHFAFRSHLDIKSMWLDLAQNITYTFSNLSSSPLNGHDFKVHHNCKIWGVGPRAGMDGKVFIGHGFSLNGEVSGSILYSYFKSRHKEDWPLIQLSQTRVVGGPQYSMKDKFHQFTPFAQMEIALGWESFLNQNRQHLSLKMGYEVQYFWRANQMSNVDQSLTYTLSGVGRPPSNFRTNSEKYAEDLMFYGITGEARLDF